MNWHDAMLAVMRGEVPDRPLFVPRLDIWYHANRRRGTLPAAIADLDLAGVAAWLGVGLHSVIPDFVRTGDDRNLHHRGLGFYNHPDFPWVADFSAVDHRVETGPETLATVYRTSRGEVTTRIRYGPELLASGMTIPDVVEPAIKCLDDYARVTEIVSRIRIVPAPGAYERHRSRMGDRGVAVAWVTAAASPMQHIMRDLRKIDGFFLDLADDPRAVQCLAEALGPVYEAHIAAAAASTAEVALLGANYDDAITFPPFFEAHIMPWLRRAADRLHAAGKLLMTHTDGENRLLLPLLRASGFDVADSICPAPMTRVPLRDYRAAFGRYVTIWGGIPSVMTLRASCGEAEFRSFVETTIAETRPWNNLILSVADTLPPDAEFDRVLYLRDRTLEAATP